MDWLNQIEFWHWLIAAVLMIIVEMVIPAAWFLWMGISAFAVGLLLYFLRDLPLLIQIIIFGVLSVSTLVLYKWRQKANPYEKDLPNLNRRGEQYVGRILTLDTPIVNGVGKVRIDDSTWRVRGMDMPAGSKVRVLSVEGTSLNVEGETVFAMP